MPQSYTSGTRGISDTVPPSSSRTSPRLPSCPSHSSPGGWSSFRRRQAPCSRSKSSSPSLIGCSTALALIGPPSAPASRWYSMLRCRNAFTGSRLSYRRNTLFFASSFVSNLLEDLVFHSEGDDGGRELSNEQAEQEEVETLQPEYTDPYRVTDFRALQARMTIRNSNTPKMTKAISIMLKAPNERHIQIAKARRAMPHTANTRFSILRTKKRQLFPPLVSSSIWITTINTVVALGK